MNCKECLKIIEEYVERELDERTTGFITAHIAGCATCAKVHDDLQREQEMYSAFLSEVTEPPALWSAVRAGMEKEAAVSATQTPMPTRTWLPGSLSYPRFGLAFGLALVIIGVGIGLMRLRSSLNTSDNRASSNPSGTASLPQNPINPSKPVEPATAGTQVKASDRTDKTLSEKNRQSDALSKHSPAANSNFARSNKMKPVQPRQLSPTPSSVAELLAGNAETIDAVQKRWNSSSLLDGETARHLEKSQMMLRSLRNAIREDEAPTSTIYHEKELSRELLAKNILLRRNAAARGDVLTENLLSRLEPLLLDVANLQDKPSSTDLRLLEERIREKEIIATLQAYIG
ncbi:MAG: anti-sigma factor [Pyrinomonadaceae bacterium]